MNSTIKFLRALRRMDDADLSVRDVLIMSTIQGEPGMTGRSLALRLGLPGRSNIQYTLPRLIQLGYIEDHRPAKHARSKVPNSFHITPKGEERLTSIIPQDFDL